ncbi:hypothetical protein Glove_283g168 [Diversispora epigaea]|uniref:RING-type domain-containing protein n=1 Tax=Diversispora epigaea TaxID=1348612 RepID=A0A397I7V3_9GLOM|nr:hypothetical protein Glove_283g168 [Diversispora epigaea]
MSLSNLKILALNILKNTSPGNIADEIIVPELDPCTLCNEELFLSLIKQPFTTLPCEHIFHRTCLEKSIINGIEICPANDCFKSFELGFEDIEISELPPFSSQDSVSIPMQISHKWYMKKRATESKKIIDELSTEYLDESKTLGSAYSVENIITQSSSVSTAENNSDLVDFFSLYRQVVKAEDNNKKTVQDAIRVYYNFGRDLKKRLKHH